MPLAAHQEAEGNDFEMEEQVQVKAERQEPTAMVNVQLQDDQQELVNGSIVYDEDGRAYRYYSSQTDYQAAQHLDMPPQGAPANSNPTPGPQLLAPVPLRHEPTSATEFEFHLQAQLGNAAPHTMGMGAGMGEASAPDANQPGNFAFGMWNGEGNAMDMSEGIALPRPLALGNAGFSM